MISNAKKALIHLARRRLAMVDADYRTLLQRAAGVASSADLDDAGFDAAMREFEHLGFKSQRAEETLGPRLGMASSTQLSRIRSLWRRYTGAEDERRLCRWLNVHFHCSHLRFLDAHTASKAIAVLMKMEHSPTARWRQRGRRREGGGQ